MSEYKAEGDAERAKTARLKALREAVSLRSRISTLTLGPQRPRTVPTGLGRPYGALGPAMDAARFFAYLPPARRP